MLVKIFGINEDAVIAEVAEVDAKTASHLGSHDDCRLVVGVNGEVRPVREWKVDHYSMHQTAADHGSGSEDPGPLPAAREIVQAFVFRSEGHYGGHSRFRSNLRFFTRRAYDRGPRFLGFDIGEVGTLAGGNFHAYDPMAALMQAAKKVKVVVEGEGPDNPLNCGDATLERIAQATKEFVRFVGEFDDLVHRYGIERDFSAPLYVRDSRLKWYAGGTKLGAIMSSTCVQGWPFWTVSP